MSSDILSFRALLGMSKRHLFVIFLSFALSLSLALAGAFYIPRKYKSSGILEITASYFRNPLVSDLIPEVSDPSELRAQRQALVTQAITNQFLDEMAAQFGIYSASLAERDKALERTYLQNRIEIFSISPTSFQVSVSAERPADAKVMTEHVIGHLRSVLIGKRFVKLSDTRDALNHHVRTLGVALENLSSSSAVKTPQLLESELKKINADLDMMLRHYTESHPEVSKGLSRAAELERQLRAVQSKEESDGDPTSILVPGAKEPVKDVYHESMRKLSYLNIVLEIEADTESSSHVVTVQQPSLPTAAYSPNRKLLLLFGLVSGFLLAAAIVLYREMRRGTFLSPERVAETLGVPYFGRLPELPGRSKGPLLLPGSTVKQFQLPMTIGEA